jgi:ketopantoate reductase
VAELGEATDTPTPYINAVYALIKLLDQTIREEGIYVKGVPVA